MIDYETFLRIKHLNSHDRLTPVQIADELNPDLKTVRKSRLDPFKKDIIRMLERRPYTAVQIFQRIKEEGFNGGYTIVKDYAAKVRPPKTPAFLKLSSAPGECAQADWGSYGSVPVGETTRRLSFFVMVMCYSRMMYVEFSLSQTMEHFLGAHQHAFEFFGGVPKRIYGRQPQISGFKTHRRPGAGL